VQAADQSPVLRIPNAVCSDVVFQRGAPPVAGQLYMDAYPAAYGNREFAFTDTVFVSK